MANLKIYKTMASVKTSTLIAEVMIELGLPDESMKPIMLTWAKEAMRAISGSGSKLFAKESDWLPISDLQFHKPKDLLTVLSIQIKGEGGGCVKPSMDSNTDSCGCCENCSSTCEVTVGENNTHFYLSSNGKQYTLAKIKYFGSAVDDCGLPLIDEKAGRAVKQYIVWKTKSTQRNKMKDSIPMSEIDYEYRLWSKLADQAYGNIMMPNKLELEKIGITWLSTGFTPANFVSSIW